MATASDTEYWASTWGCSIAYLCASFQHIFFINSTFKDPRRHKLWVQLNRVITELGSGDCFETLTALGKIRVALDPSEAVHVGTRAALELVLRILSETRLEEHVDTMRFRPRFEKGEIEEVAVERGHDRRFCGSDVFKESADCRRLYLGSNTEAANNKVRDQPHPLH